MTHILYSKNRTATLLIIAALLQPVAAAAMPLNQAKEKNHDAIIIPLDRHAAVSQGAKKIAGFKRLNRNVLTINYVNKRPVAVRDTHLQTVAPIAVKSEKVSKRVSRHKTELASTLPAGSSATDVLSLYGEGDISPGHPFNH
jgi:hypothetical protein